MNVPDFSNRLVLVVDDDEHTRTLLSDLCTSQGFRVLTAADGVEAYQLASKEKPDLVLLDLMMPKRDGFSVLASMRENTALKEIPVIILTAMGDLDGKIRGMELGADDYVTKPFKLIELQTRITSALTVREYRQRLAAAEEELAQFRALDPVTGAATYSQLKASLDGELARSRRYGRPLSTLLFGFDDYPGLRYRLGRDGCDAYLARVATEVRKALRGADRLFRVDADEFVVLLPETNGPASRLTAERLLKLLSAPPTDTQSASVIRCGGATFPSERVRTSEDLLREANRSFRYLKEQRNSVLFEL
jgi:two-component system, cell cycle response regulator